jgi:prepilin-type N-terminal cleavage/methylation domain-containing protein
MKWGHSRLSSDSRQIKRGHSSFSPSRAKKRNVPISFSGAAGFTIAEVLVVVIIIGVVAVTALPTFSSRDTARLDLAAEEFADAIRFARSESIRTGVPHGVRVNEVQEFLKVFRLDMAPDPPVKLFDVYHPVAKNLYTLDTDTGLTRGVTVDNHQLTYSSACNGPNGFAFDTRGNPICANPVSVRVTTAAVTLGFDGATRDVNVAPITGRVTVQ